MDEEKYTEEGTISLKQVIVLLFGNIKRYLIIAVASLVVSFVAIFFINRASQDYTSMFSLKIAGLTEDTYIDGSRFDCRDLITLEKLKKYQREHEELKDIDMAKVYSNGGIKNFEYVVEYVENQAKVNSTDPDYIVDKEGYSITLSRDYFTKEQAAVLVDAIANEPIEITLSLESNLEYRDNLDLYTTSKNYEDKLSYLKKQLTFINTKITDLITEYGDLQIKNGTYGLSDNAYSVDSKKLLSDFKNDLAKDTQYIEFDSLTNELSMFGYIYTAGTTKTELESKLQQYTKDLEKLTKEKATITNKKDNLLEILEDLITKATGSQLQTLELEAYSKSITEYVSEIEDLQYDIDRLQVKINNLQAEITLKDNDQATVTREYDSNDVSSFQEQLEDAYKILNKYTEAYSDVEEYIVSINCNVYYLQSTVVEKVEGLSIVVVGLISLAVAIFLPMLVNCFLAIVKTVKEADLKEKEEKANIHKE